MIESSKYFESAKIIKSKARRPGDIAARIGGDEFVLVLSRVTKKKAMLVVDEICQKVDSLNMVIDSNISISLSAGVSTMKSTDKDKKFQYFYQQADEQLYVQKRRRGSRCSG